MLETAIGFAIDWAYLLFALSIAGRLREVTIPERPTFVKQTGIISIACNGAEWAAGFVVGDLGWVAAAIVFWTLLHRWFDVDLQAAIWLMIIGAVTHLILEGVLLSVVLAGV